MNVQLLRLLYVEYEVAMNCSKPYGPHQYVPRLESSINCSDSSEIKRNCVYPIKITIITGNSIYFIRALQGHGKKTSA